MRERNTNKNAFIRKPTAHFGLEIETHCHLIPEWPWPQNDCDLQMTWTLMMILVPYIGHSIWIWCPWVLKAHLLKWHWPWPWPNGLDTQAWPRYVQDVQPYQQNSVYVKVFKSYSPNRHTTRQTQRHTGTQTVWKHYLPHMPAVKMFLKN